MFTPRLLSRRVVIAFLTLPAVALAAHPSLADSLGLDVWNYPELHRNLEEARTRQKELDGRDEDVRRRIAIKEALIADLIAGNSSLEDICRHFQTLNEQSPEYMEVIRVTYSGSTDLEKISQNVVDFAALRAPDGPERERLQSRLEAERARLIRPGIAQ